jgi:hypothetical protein
VLQPPSVALVIDINNVIVAGVARLTGMWT